MAKLEGTFDSNGHDDMNTGFDPLPKGTYFAVVKKTEICTTKTKTGKYIKLEFEVIKGEFKGRLFWTNLNIVNPNPVAVDIAQKELATLCRAVGKTVIKDTDELLNKPLQVVLKVKPAKGDFPPGNEPIGYLPAKTPNKDAETPDFAEDEEADEPGEMKGSESTEAPDEDDDGEIPWGD